MLVCADANFINHLHERKGVSSADVNTVRRAVRLRRFRLLATDVLIEELLATFAADRSKARAMLTLLLELSNVRDCAVIAHELLLGGDVRAYYLGTGQPDRFMSRTDSARLHQSLQRLAEGRSDAGDLAEAQKETSEDKGRFRESMRAAKEAVKPEVAKLESTPTFEAYRNGIAPGLLAVLGKAVGVERELLEKGTDEVLRTRTVAAYTGYTASMIYRQTIEARAPKLGDSRDQIHAIFSGIADVFVSDDAELRLHLSRAGIPNLEVLDLPGFVARVR